MQNVLDDIVDKEAGAKPKLVGPPAPSSVGSAVRHISQEELDAYYEGRLSGARLDFVRGHLDACEGCRAELTDLRTYKANAVGMSQASSLKRELERRRRQRMLKTGATAAVAAAVVALGGVVAWNKFGKAWVHKASVATAAAVRATADAATAKEQPRSVAPAPDETATTGSATAQVADVRTAATQPHATPIAQSGTAEAPVTNGLQGTEHGTAPNAVASTQTIGAAQPHGATAVPAAQAHANGAGIAAQPAAQAHANGVGVTAQPAAQAHGTTPVAVATTVGAAPRQQARSATQATAPASGAVAAGSTSFALLGPFGDEVTDDRPEFAWQPLEGATKYSIIIVDEGLRPIAHTRLKTTTWRPKKPLRRGRSYLWQVTAILKNGTKVMATGPTSQEARIHIGAPAM
jgi:hypothetical protein